jgi:uncharacterized membrane protein
MSKRLWCSFSICGLLLGALFFAASLTPTLLPRTYVTQGVLSGCSIAAGYSIGAFGRWVWDYMELPQPKGRILLVIKLAAAAGCAIIAVVSLWQAARWQNSIRELMQLDPVDTVYPLQVTMIALVAFAITMVLARLFRLTLPIVAMRADRFVPRRVSNVIGIVAVVALFWSIIDGVFFRVALRTADASYQQLDKLIEPETRAPVDPQKSGSSASLLTWQELGRAGREFISTGPTRGDISAFSGQAALEPVRTYVGLRSADTVEARAKLALEELKRAGGFERRVLVVITPTGTGWVDPAAMNGLEYLHNGDVASVALQYSYLGSWLYLLVGADYGADAARALFNEVYAYWTTLPRANRPRLYLHGLSLGAKYSQMSTDLIEVFGDPIAGALWSGPPHSSRLWRFLTENRNPGSPAWLPRFQNGSFVRFRNQHGDAADQVSIPNAAWGPIRLIYLQYASDPVTFFDNRSFYREPDWMLPPRGPDVSPQLRWLPVVTFFQLALDMFMALEAPIGHGHVYAPAHYIDAWIEVTDVRDWSEQKIAQLKRHLSKPQSEAAIRPPATAEAKF